MIVQSASTCSQLCTTEKLVNLYCNCSNSNHQDKTFLTNEGRVCPTDQWEDCDFLEPSTYFYVRQPQPDTSSVLDNLNNHDIMDNRVLDTFLFITEVWNFINTYIRTFANCTFTFHITIIFNEFDPFTYHSCGLKKISISPQYWVYFFQ